MKKGLFSFMLVVSIMMMSIPAFGAEVFNKTIFEGNENYLLLMDIDGPTYMFSATTMEPDILTAELDNGKEIPVRFQIIATSEDYATPELVFEVEDRMDVDEVVITTDKNEYTFYDASIELLAEDAFEIIKELGEMTNPAIVQIKGKTKSLTGNLIPKSQDTLLMVYDDIHAAHVFDLELVEFAVKNHAIDKYQIKPVKNK